MLECTPRVASARITALRVRVNLQQLWSDEFCEEGCFLRRCHYDKAGPCCVKRMVAIWDDGLPCSVRNYGCHGDGVGAALNGMPMEEYMKKFIVQDWAQMPRNTWKGLRERILRARKWRRKRAGRKARLAPSGSAELVSSRGPKPGSSDDSQQLMTTASSKASKRAPEVPMPTKPHLLNATELLLRLLHANKRS